MSELDVKPWNYYLSEYTGKHKILLKALEDSDLPIPERLKIYETELAKLKADFASKRKTEFEAISTELSRGHSCTKGYSGGKKDCGWKCVKTPKTGMYTRREWVRHEGTSKGIRVSDTEACIRMTRASKGRNAGRIFAIFRYKPSFIQSTIDREIAELFNLILTNDDFDDHVDERVASLIEFEDLGIDDPDSPDESLV